MNNFIRKNWLFFAIPAFAIQIIKMQSWVPDFIKKIETLQIIIICSIIFIIPGLIKLIVNKNKKFSGTDNGNKKEGGKPKPQPESKKYGWQVALIWVIPSLVLVWFLWDRIVIAASTNPLIAGIFVLLLVVSLSWAFSMGRPVPIESTATFRLWMTIILVVAGVTFILLTQFGVIGGPASAKNPPAAKNSSQQTSPPKTFDSDDMSGCKVHEKDGTFHITIPSNQSGQLIDTGIFASTGKKFKLTNLDDSKFGLSSFGSIQKWPTTKKRVFWQVDKSMPVKLWVPTTQKETSFKLVFYK